MDGTQHRKNWIKHGYLLFCFVSISSSEHLGKIFSHRIVRSAGPGGQNLIFSSLITCSQVGDGQLHDFSVCSDRKGQDREYKQVKERFLLRVDGCSFRDQISGGSSLACFGHLIRILLGRLPFYVFWAGPSGRRPWSWKA